MQEAGFDPWSGRSPGGGKDNPLQCSSPDSPRNRGAWRAAVHGRSLEEERTTHSSVLAWRVPGTEEPGGLQSMEDPLEEERTTHSSVLARRVPGTEEPGGLQPTGLQTVGLD